MDEYSGDSLFSQVTVSTPYYTSAGRIVYGGGGILPDKKIHLKTDTNIVYYNKLLNKGTINDYVFDYVSLKGAGIRSRYADGLSFEKHFVVSDAMMRDLFAKAEKDGIKRNEKGIASFYNEIRTRVKAEIGDMLYGSDTFYKLLLPFDSEVKEAMRAFK
jgi:carboxyl-terminal processing protease